MSKITILIIVLIFLNNCSFNKNSRIWKDDRKKESFKKENVTKLFVEEEKISSEFNPKLEINLTKINQNNRVSNNRNDYGSQNYKGLLDKDLSFTFSKLENLNELDYKPVFLENGLIFFDKKGSIIRYEIGRAHV